MHPRTLAVLGTLSAGLALGLPACTHKPSTPQALSAYVLEAKHGLTQTLRAGEVQVQVSYRPTDLLVAQELGAAQPTEEQVLGLRNKYDQYYYFVVSLSRHQKDVLDASAQGTAGFSELLQRISFGMGDVLSLTTPRQDTIPVADYLYQRTYGMGNSTDILVVFPKAKASKQPWIELHLTEFGLGIGRQKVRFSVDDLEEAPQLYSL